MTSDWVTVIEVGLLGWLIVWSALSLGCVFGAPGWQALNARLGRIHVFVDWTMFGTGGGAAVGTRSWFEYRDFGPAGKPSEWRKFADTGAAWVWHAFAWDPRRRLSDRLRILAKEIRQAVTAQPPSPETLARLSALIADHLHTCVPGAPGVKRQIRIVTEPWRSTRGPDGKLSRELRFVELEPFVAETSPTAQTA